SALHLSIAAIHVDLHSFPTRRSSDLVGGFDVLCLQHEFGIFGGKCGAHILDTLNRCTIPVITTLHTVLENPTHDERRVMSEIVQDRKSTRLNSSHVKSSYAVFCLKKK